MPVFEPEDIKGPKVNACQARFPKIAQASKLNSHRQNFLFWNQSDSEVSDVRLFALFL